MWIDRTLIARALTNVVENALQAMPEGGTMRVSAASRGATIEMTVTDTGVGMDAEAVRRAFEPYFSTKTAGSGLGLANAKRNVELCGGTMTLSSDAGSRDDGHPEAAGGSPSRRARTRVTTSSTNAESR